MQAFQIKMGTNPSPVATRPGVPAVPMPTQQGVSAVTPQQRIGVISAQPVPGAAVGVGGVAIGGMGVGNIPGMVAQQQMANRPVAPAAAVGYARMERGRGEGRDMVITDVR